MARRHAAAEKASQESNLEQQQAALQATTIADPTRPFGERPTMQGRLQEVDLGEEVRMRNAAMTEQARRRLAGEAVDDVEDGSRKRPRLGKDGKPWRSRKRRGSEDVKRDQLVEELMRENRRMLLSSPTFYVWETMLILAQSMSTMYPPSRIPLASPALMKPRTRRSQQISAASSWMPCLRGDTSEGKHQPSRPNLERSKRKSSRGRNWAAAGMRGLRCGTFCCRSRRSRRRDERHHLLRYWRLVALPATQCQIWRLTSKMALTANCRQY